MKIAILAATLLLAMSTTNAGEPPPILTADVFRLIRIEQDSLKVTYGVFAFRHHHATQLALWGRDPPNGRRFSPAGPQYEYRTDAGWKTLVFPYCGTGVEQYVIRSGVDYELRVILSALGPHPPYVGNVNLAGWELRICLDSPQGVFRSDSFHYPVVGVPEEKKDK